MTSLKIAQAQKAVQEDPLSLYEELFLISPSWANLLFKTHLSHEGLNNSRSCVVGEAHHGDRKYPASDGSRCFICSEYSLKIFGKSNHSSVVSKHKPYNEDAFHASISGFINHFKEKHQK